MNRNDLRIRKTKANLYKGLITLLKKKSFEEISIVDICKSSSINRSTFYDHFNDKYELLYSLLYSFSDEIVNIIKKSNTNLADTFKLICLETINLIRDDKNYKLFNIINNYNNSYIKDMIYDVMNKSITDYNKKDKDKIVFYMGGLSSIIANNVFNEDITDKSLINKLNSFIMRF